MEPEKFGKEQALQILSEVCRKPTEELTPETHLIHDLNLDSALTLELLMTLEDNLGKEITEVEAAKLVTVGDVIQLVEN